MKSYKGRRIPGKCIVIKDNGEMLKMRLDIANHSPTGPEWGFEGSGPAQLALAILIDFFGDDKRRMVEEVYQTFKRDIIATLPEKEWEITAHDIIAWYDRNQGKEMAMRCPKCGARDTLTVTSYQVGNANTPLTLAFSAETHKAFDFELDRTEGELSEVDCYCEACECEMTLDEVMEAHQ
jgi:hypothetical protein